MNEKLTLEEFEKLLDAYMGAMNHVAWVREHGTVPMHSVAVDAAVVARNALLKAVFPDERND